MPAVGCCILARPTKQMGFFRQMVGRVLRPADGKPDAIILDHSGAVYRHGLPEDHVEWTLDTDRRAVNPTHDKRLRDDVEQRLRECPSCKVVMTVPPCAACGWMPKPRARDVDMIDGQLGLVISGQASRPSNPSPAEIEQTVGELKGIYLEKLQRKPHYKIGWVGFKAQERLHLPNPPWNAVHNVEPRDPSPELRRWVRSRDIAFAKRAAAS